MGYEKNIKTEGNGEYPSAGDTITVHCTGYVTATEAKFWSTKDEGQSPFTFQVGLGKVIKGWDEGMLTMAVGEVADLVCSADYAYGANGFPAWGIPPNAELRFEVEVLSIEKA